MPIKKAAKSSLRTYQRQAEALELRLSGLTFPEISKKMGLVKGTVWKLVHDAMASTLRESSDAVRAMELDRLDRLTKILDKRIQNGYDDKAISSYMKVMDHRAKLLGLYAPVTLQGPDGEAIRFVVELPAKAPSLAEWKAQAAQIIDVSTLTEANNG